MIAAIWAWLAAMKGFHREAQTVGYSLPQEGLAGTRLDARPGESEPIALFGGSGKRPWSAESFRNETTGNRSSLQGKRTPP